MQAPKRATSGKRDGPHKKPARRRQSGYHQGLTQEGIAAAALALVDREGLEALSYRRLADAIGCEAMSLYHHFPSKAHLVDAVIDLVFGDLQVPPAPLTKGGGDWIDCVRRAGWNYRAMALAHPKLYPLMAVHRMNTRTGVRKLDEVIGLFRAGGFDDATAARLFREFGYYLTGAALDETAGYAKGPSAAEPVSDAEVGRDCPNLAAVAAYFKPQHFEQTFAHGLELLLESMARLRKKA